jgi:hypothetical protein
MLESLLQAFWAFWTAVLVLGLMGAEARPGKRVWWEGEE